MADEVLYLRVPAELKRALQARADAERRSLTQVAVFALEEYLAPVGDPTAGVEKYEGLVAAAGAQIRDRVEGKPAPKAGCAHAQRKQLPYGTWCEDCGEKLR